jgi:3-deoxy-D-manno-octulosonic-acid transferase
MLAYYAISYLAIIGGSFKGFGGQNPIEAIFMHVPVAFGNSMYNFNEVAENCLTDGCAYKIDSISQLSVVIHKLLHSVSEYVELKDSCNKFISKYQGASQRVFDIVKQSL